jgi:hypothetical protein
VDNQARHININSKGGDPGAKPSLTLRTSPHHTAPKRPETPAPKPPDQLRHYAGIRTFRLNEHERNMTATLEAIKKAAEQG